MPSAARDTVINVAEMGHAVLHRDQSEGWWKGQGGRRLSPSTTSSRLSGRRPFRLAVSAPRVSDQKSGYRLVSDQNFGWRLLYLFL